MRTVVTGGAGFIGSRLVRRLLADEQNQVINLDALRHSGNLENLSDVANHPRDTFLHGDICDADTVARVVKDCAVEAGINCAAETHVDRSLLDPQSFARPDVVGTGLLLEQARQSGVSRYLQVSTDKEYGSVEF